MDMQNQYPGFSAAKSSDKEKAPKSELVAGKVVRREGFEPPTY